MGFFDELEAKVGAVPKADDGGSATTPPAALAAAVDKLASGWVFEGLLSPPLPERQGDDDEAVEQRVTIAYDRGRFSIVHSTRQSRYAKRPTRTAPTERRVDREGLLETLRNEPLLARRLVAAVTGADPVTFEPIPGRTPTAD